VTCVITHISLTQCYSSGLFDWGAIVLDLRGCLHSVGPFRHEFWRRDIPALLPLPRSPGRGPYKTAIRAITPRAKKRWSWPKCLRFLAGRHLRRLQFGCVVRLGCHIRSRLLSNRYFNGRFTSECSGWFRLCSFPDHALCDCLGSVRAHELCGPIPSVDGPGNTRFTPPPAGLLGSNSPTTKRSIVITQSNDAARCCPDWLSEQSALRGLSATQAQSHTTYAAPLRDVLGSLLNPQPA